MFSKAERFKSVSMLKEEEKTSMLPTIFPKQR